MFFFCAQNSRQQFIDAHGAVHVHEAIDNPDPATTAAPAIPRQTPEKETITSKKALCSKCCQHKPKDKGNYAGRSKKVFYCHECTALDARIARLTKGTKGQTLWKDLPAEEKQAFRLEKMLSRRLH